MAEKSRQWYLDRSRGWALAETFHHSPGSGQSQSPNVTLQPLKPLRLSVETRLLLSTQPAAVEFHPAPSNPISTLLQRWGFPKKATDLLTFPLLPLRQDLKRRRWIRCNLCPRGVHRPGKRQRQIKTEQWYKGGKESWTGHHRACGLGCRSYWDSVAPEGLMEWRVGLRW